MNRRSAITLLGGAMLERPAAGQMKNLKEALAELTPDSRRIAAEVFGRAGFAGSVPAADVARLQKAERKTADEVAILLLPVAKLFSRPPISDFHVGAIVTGNTGGLYFGANIEFAGQFLGLTVHGEQAAAANAYMHEETGLKSITLTEAPCGHCRQFLEEFSVGRELPITIKGQAPVQLSALLPAAFGPKDLGMRQGALPVGRVKITLPQGGGDPVVAAALRAASMSWAPYSKSRSGVAIRCSDGSLHIGSYIENAAFNPSLSPFAVALVRLITSNRGAAEIAGVTLVELEKAAISQRSVTEMALRAMRPDLKLQVVAGKLA